MTLSQVSDDVIREEYRRRFTIPVGDPIHCSADAVDHLRQFVSDPARESFIVVFLSNSNRLMHT